MEFHNWETLFSIHDGRIEKNGPRLSASDFTRTAKSNFEIAARRLMIDKDQASKSICRLESERVWMAHKKPYYSIYPAFTESLLKIKLDIDCSLIKLPVEALLVRFAKTHEMIGANEEPVRSFLACICDSPVGRMAVIVIDDNDNQRDRKSYLNFHLENGVTIEQAIAKVEQWDSARPEFKKEVEKILRISCALCLLADDPSIITPDVLAEDRRRFEESGDLKYVERAHRRGKVGWIVGAEIESCPHYRRPHLALRWTGEGHAIPKIVPVKGAIVHRNKITDVPMGYLDNEQDKPTK